MLVSLKSRRFPPAVLTPDRTKSSSVVASNYESACTWDIYSIGPLGAMFEVAEKAAGKWREKTI
jgi:hypothetical protein